MFIKSKYSKTVESISFNEFIQTLTRNDYENTHYTYLQRIYDVVILYLQHF